MKTSSRPPKRVALALVLIMLLSAFAMVPAVAEEPEKLVIALQSNNFITDYDDNYLTNLLEERLGIDIEFYMLPAASDEIRTKVSLMAAAPDTMPDVIIVDNAFTREMILDYGSKGAFIPLNDYLANPELTPFYQQIAEEDKEVMLRAMTSADGNIYTLPKYEPETWNLTPNRMFMNTTWLETLGLEVPTTTDELYDVLVAFRDGDPNGNGVADEIGVYGYFGGGYGQNIIMPLMNAFVYFSSYEKLALDDAGNVHAPFTTEGWQKGLTYLNTLYKEGLLAASLFTDDQTQYRAVLNNEINIVGITSAGSLSNWPEVETNPNFAEMDIIAPLTGPDGLCYAAYSEYSPSLNFFITSNCKNPELAITLGDLFFEEEMTNIVRFGEPGVDFTQDPEEMAGTSNAYVEAGLVDGLYLAYKTSIWSEPSNKFWHNINPRYATLTRGNSAGDLVTPYDSNLKTVGYNAYNYEHYYPKHPDVVLPELTYTIEEATATGESITNITEYLKQAIAEFVTGARDPQADWDGYLKELDSMGLQEWIATAQTAYDRIK